MRDHETFPQLTPDLLLTAYATGIFPMAEGRGEAEIFWVDPHYRGIMPLDRFHISRSLVRRMRRGGFHVTVDEAFAEVVDGCADRDETWINDTIFLLYEQLHRSGQAHSLEVWEPGGTLVGGVYGVEMGAAFFGESMFSRATDASKVALACLVDLLRTNGFILFDTQFLTEHLRSLGGEEIPRDHYHLRLRDAISRPARFDRRRLRSPQEVVQRKTQTS